MSLFQRGVISTSKNEFNPTLTADGKTLYIVHSLPGFKESKIMVSQFVKDKWTIPEPVSFSDTRYRDSDPCITPDGKILFFISNRPTDGSETAKVDYDIWKAELINGNWSKLIPIKEVNSSQMELGVEYSNGILYFNSTRGGQATSSDIYYSILENGVFSEPINIGAPINTSKFEADPVISTDGNYLVYSAWDRTEGRGQGDLYVSKKTEDGWSEAVNLGDEINSSAFEFTPFFSYDGKYLFFTSDIQDKTSSKKDKEILNGQFNVYRVSVKKLFKSLSLI
ncbi:hypothetical protein [Marivirga sp.]|uniref:TolB family protein n=1 Tax=Marivirga sp. TaxID=2018662 RepID=UPI002D7F9E58|nr:hypothetical protein [Marivirga sp.]HET8859362.1 hypothetical protein [Marivirga sp.]